MRHRNRGGIEESTRRKGGKGITLHLIKKYSELKGKDPSSRRLAWGSVIKIGAGCRSTENTEQRADLEKGGAG